MNEATHQELAERYGIIVLVQFGSTVSGKTHPKSDLDLAVLLERLIGRMIDVNYHLVVESGEPPPRDYHASFGELGVLPCDFARAISSAAGLRNRIVQEYESIDPAQIHTALRRATEDIPRYIEHVTVFLDSTQ